MDGKPGPRTRTAVMVFQRSLGAVLTGEADAGLLAALKADAMRAFGHNRIADVRLVQRILGVRGLTRVGSMTLSDRGQKRRSWHSSGRSRAHHPRTRRMRRSLVPCLPNADPSQTSSGHEVGPPLGA